MTDRRDPSKPTHDLADRKPGRSERAKRNGRVHDLRSAREADLDRALSRIWMAYQPIVSALDHSLFGYEALVRTEDPLISDPGALFTVAEEFDRVSEVERIIQHKIAEQAGEAPPDATLLVNVHPHSLEADFLYDPTSPLSRIATRVVLEVTERSSLHSTDDVQGRIEALRALGFRIAIDDLGAGYAGLTSFAMLNPDIVKFDMGLVRDVHLSPMKCRVVRSMAGLCRELGIQAVAEGIESKEERDCVVELGCDLLQGYYFARPSKGFVQPEPAG